MCRITNRRLEDYIKYGLIPQPIIKYKSYASPQRCYRSWKIGEFLSHIAKEKERWEINIID